MGEGKKEFPLKDRKKFKSYIEDIEKQTNRKMSREQKNLLRKDLQKNNYSKLSKADKEKHRKDFSNKKDVLINEWERKTGQIWPKHGGIGEK